MCGYFCFPYCFRLVNVLLKGGGSTYSHVAASCPGNWDRLSPGLLPDELTWGQDGELQGEHSGFLCKENLARPSFSIHFVICCTDQGHSWCWDPTASFLSCVLLGSGLSLVRSTVCSRSLSWEHGSHCHRGREEAHPTVITVWGTLSLGLRVAQVRESHPVQDPPPEAQSWQNNL